MRPEEIKKIAAGLVRHWPVWESVAGQVAQTQQDAVAGEQTMIEFVADYLKPYVQPLQLRGCEG
jgi:hypothetical protein